MVVAHFTPPSGREGNTSSPPSSGCDHAPCTWDYHDDSLVANRRLSPWVTDVVVTHDATHTDAVVTHDATHTDAVVSHGATPWVSMSQSCHPGLSHLRILQHTVDCTLGGAYKYTLYATSPGYLALRCLVVHSRVTRLSLSCTWQHIPWVRHHPPGDCQLLTVTTKLLGSFGYTPHTVPAKVSSSRRSQVQCWVHVLLKQTLQHMVKFDPPQHLSLYKITYLFTYHKLHFFFYKILTSSTASYNIKFIMIKTHKI